MEYRASQVERDGVVYRVEGRPLPPVTFHGGFREKRLARPSADLWAVVPGAQGWGVGLALIGAAAGAVRVVWASLQSGYAGGVSAVVVILAGAFAAAFGVTGLSVLTDRTRLDRAAGRASRRRLGRTVWSVDLPEVLAVQCLFAGQQRSRSGWIREYQVNLVLRGEGDRRVPMCGAGDADWARSLGRDLAGFLGIPVVDQS